MKYLSIDIETTGLDESWCQVLEVGCVLADTLDTATPVYNLPQWSCRLFHDRVQGEPYALWLNAELIKDMDRARKDMAFADSKNYIRPGLVFHQMAAWLGLGLGSQKVAPAGKNYGTFDSRFLWALPSWQRERLLHRRVLDPAQAFTLPEDERPPDLKTCIERAGLTDWDESLHHKAIEDAKVVVRLLRAGDDFLRRRLCTSISSPATPTSGSLPPDLTR